MVTPNFNKSVISSDGEWGGMISRKGCTQEWEAGKACTSGNNHPDLLCTKGSQAAELSVLNQMGQLGHPRLCSICGALSFKDGYMGLCYIISVPFCRLRTFHCEKRRVRESLPRDVCSGGAPKRKSLIMWGDQKRFVGGTI